MARQKKAEYIRPEPLSRDEIRRMIREGKRFKELARDYHPKNLEIYREEFTAWARRVPESVTLEKALRNAFSLVAAWYSNDRTRLELDMRTMKLENAATLQLIEQHGYSAADTFKPTKSQQERENDFEQWLQNHIYANEKNAALYDN